MKIFTKVLNSIIITSFALFVSCNIEPYEGPIPSPDVPLVNGEFKVDFDGQTFVSSTNQAIVNSSFIAITGLKTSGEFFQITIPNGGVGAYSLNANPTGFALIYSSGSGVSPFMAASDSVGEFANFSNYTDNSQVVITNIDTFNKKISGTFKFTGVKFADNTGNSVVTKSFTNGSFTNLEYTADVATPPNTNQFFAKLDNVDFIPTNITAVKSSGKIAVIGRRGSIENIGLTFPDNVAAGTTFNFGPLDDDRGQYVQDATPAGVYSGTGTLTIVSHNLTTKRVTGTFSFTAATLIPPILSKQITVGTFDVTYP